MSTPQASDSVRQRLLESGRHCFLEDDYHNVTTRQIADAAGANVSMIRYYFGNKEGLYEAVLRETLNPLMDALNSDTLNTPDGFEIFLRNYYREMRNITGFPKLILRVLALNHGPGYRFLLELLKRGQEKSLKLTQEASFADTRPLNEAAELARMALVSLALMPILLQGTFETQRGQPLDDRFFDELATFNGRIFLSGINPPRSV